VDSAGDYVPFHNYANLFFRTTKIVLLTSKWVPDRYLQISAIFADMDKIQILFSMIQQIPIWIQIVSKAWLRCLSSVRNLLN